MSEGFKHTPRKRFGQNFLQDQRIIQQILEALNPDPQDNILEIGPGLGALTQPLLRHLQKLTAIEIDRDLQVHLKQLSNAAEKLTLIGADALTIDYSEFGTKLRIVGNLPYNISTPLILHLLRYPEYIEDMHFMLQKEVVQRLAAKPDTKAYGRLSIITQYFCEVEYLFDVPPESFYPAPKVDSAVVKLTPGRQHSHEAVDVSALENLVAKAFGMRRKTLANNLKGIMTPEKLQTLHIDPVKRPEQITIAEYIRITNNLE